MCKTVLPHPSASPHPTALRVGIRDEVRVRGQGWNGHLGWGKAQRRDEGWDGGSVWQTKHTSPGVMCFPHLLIFERPLIILGMLSAHSLRLLLFFE